MTNTKRITLQAQSVIMHILQHRQEKCFIYVYALIEILHLWIILVLCLDCWFVGVFVDLVVYQLFLESLTSRFFDVLVKLIAGAEELGDLGAGAFDWAQNGYLPILLVEQFTLKPRR